MKNMFALALLTFLATTLEAQKIYISADMEGIGGVVRGPVLHRPARSPDY